jgi:hypothetical protein
MLNCEARIGKLYIFHCGVNSSYSNSSLFEMLVTEIHILSAEMQQHI